MLTSSSFDIFVPPLPPSPQPSPSLRTSNAKHVDIVTGRSGDPIVTLLRETRRYRYWSVRRSHRDAVVQIMRLRGNGSRRRSHRARYRYGPVRRFHRDAFVQFQEEWSAILPVFVNASIEPIVNPASASPSINANTVASKAQRPTTTDGYSTADRFRRSNTVTRICSGSCDFPLRSTDRISSWYPIRTTEFHPRQCSFTWSDRAIRIATTHYYSHPYHQ